VDDKLYFVANDGTNGDELWWVESVGLAQMVVNPLTTGGVRLGSASSDPNSLINIDGTLYFVANDGVNGVELWRINALQQAEMVEDAVAGGGLAPGSANADPAGLVNVNGTLYFGAASTSSVTPRPLWRINGAGLAEQVASTTGNPANNLVVNDMLYYTISNEMWRVNALGQAELLDFNVGSPYVSSLTNVNGVVYFIEGANLRRLNALNQDELVKALVGDNPSNIGYLTTVNDTLYFRFYDSVNGNELWRVSAQTAAQMVDDTAPGVGIWPGNTGNTSDQWHLLNLNGTLYFSADNGVDGEELWRINPSGVAEIVPGTIPGNYIRPGIVSSGISQLTNINGTLYFTADNGVDGEELWRVNSQGQVEMVEDAVPGGGINAQSDHLDPHYLTNVNGTLYFAANDGTKGMELWRINQLGQPEMVEDALPGGGIRPDAYGSDPRDFVVSNGTLYFTADDGTNGVELWRVNAQGQAEMVEDNIPGGGIFLDPENLGPKYLTDVNGVLYFVANDGLNSYELWRINGSGQAEMVEDSIAGGGINPGLSSSFPQQLTHTLGTLYFSATNSTHGRELWRINNLGLAELVNSNVSGGGLVSGSNSADPQELTEIDGILYFIVYSFSAAELWKINNAGTAEIVTTGSEYLPRYLTNANGTLYFSARNSTSGTELWRLNPSGQPEMVEDAIPGGGMNPGSANATPQFLTMVGDELYFSADDGANGRELWRVGSTGIAEMISASSPGSGIQPGATGSNPQQLTNVNGTLYFTANDGANGRELWRVNAAGIAEMVESLPQNGGIAAGSASSSPQSLVEIEGVLYFSATDSTNGRELWRVDDSGLPELISGAVLGDGIYPGSGSANPQELVLVGQTIYFRAEDGTTGRELWSYTLPSPPTAVITPIAPDPSNQALNSLEIVFSEPVNGFDLSDLLLVRDGSSNLLTGAQTLSTIDQVTWTLENLANLTGVSGNYTLTLTSQNSGITDPEGTLLASDASESFTISLPLYVTTTADSSAGSLRQAILDANATPGISDTIIFDLPTAGSNQIELITALPPMLDPTTVDVPSGWFVELIGQAPSTISSFSQLTKTGGGTLVIGGDQQHSLPAMMIVDAGQLTLAGNGGDNLQINVNNAASLLIAADQQLAGLWIDAGGNAAISAAQTYTLDLSGLNIDSGGRFDVANSNVIVRASTETRAGVHAELSDRLAAGYNSGQWNGASGIVSSVAPTESLLRSVGILLNDNGIGQPYHATLGGQPVGINDVLLRLTIPGDTKLDRDVDFDDAFAMVANYGVTTGASWSTGDVNYDGDVDFDDSFTLVAYYNSVVPAMAAATQTVFALTSQPSIEIVQETNQSFASDAGLTSEQPTQYETVALVNELPSLPNPQAAEAVSADPMVISASIHEKAVVGQASAGVMTALDISYSQRSLDKSRTGVGTHALQSNEAPNLLRDESHAAKRDAANTDQLRNSSTIEFHAAIDEALTQWDELPEIAVGEVSDLALMLEYHQEIGF
jgi:ELWxxDGT repeat protein